MGYGFTRSFPRAQSRGARLPLLDDHPLLSLVGVAATLGAIIFIVLWHAAC
jgi:hypothetical protein